MKDLKPRLFQACQGWLQKRLDGLRSKQNDLNEALNTETKSTAGDKHETGRAMLQLEREKLGHQIIQFEQLQQVLDKIDPHKTHLKAVLGSVILTRQFNYFIAISCGEISVDDKKFYAISAATPIAKQLMYKSEGETITYRGSTIEILNIL